MNKQIDVTLNIKGDIKEIQHLLHLMDKHDLEISVTEQPATVAVTIPTKKATKKAEKEETEEQGSFDLGDDNPETMTTEEDFGEEETAVQTLTSLDIVKAFQEYAKKNSREKALKVLAKFKVKKVKDLDVKQYTDVMKALG